MAIQVNGTTVINNSRALQNISSVDATTVAALGNAGVGGLTTVLTDNGTVNSSRLSISFTGGYDRYIISLSDIRPSSDNQTWYMRLLNSSGSDITTGDHYVHGFSHTNGGYYRDVNNYVKLQNDNNYSGHRNGLTMDVWYPYSTSRHTYGHWQNIGVNGAAIPREANTGSWSAPNSTSVDRHNGCYFYFDTGNIVGAYSVWGVNN